MPSLTPQPTPYSDYNVFDQMVDNDWANFGLRLAAPMMQGMLPDDTAFLGTGDRNLADRMRAQELTQRHDDFVSDLSRMDESAYRENLQNFAQMMPFDVDPGYIDNMAKFVADNAGFAITMFPEMVDTMAGPGGSQGVMAHQMFRMLERRADPVTGERGFDQEQSKEFVTSLYDEMFSGNRHHNMPLRAGEVGELASHLDARGLLPAGQSLPLPEAGESLLDRTQEDIDEFVSRPGVAQEMRQTDIQRVKDKLQGYSKTVAALGEIFNDSGMDASIPALLEALDTFTSDSGHQYDPERLTMSVRNTFGLGHEAGLGAQQTMQLTANMSQIAEQMGLDGIYGQIGAQTAAATMAGLKASGQSVGGFGTKTIEEIGAMRAITEMSGAKSDLGRRVAAAGILKDAHDVKAGSELESALAAAERGDVSAFQGNEQDVAEMIAEGFGMQNSSQALMLMQNDAVAHEFYSREDALSMGARAGTHKEQVKQHAQVLASRLQGAAAVSMEGASAEAIKSVSDQVAREIAGGGMSLETLKDREAFNKHVGAIIRRAAPEQGMTVAESELAADIFRYTAEDEIAKAPVGANGDSLEAVAQWASRDAAAKAENARAYTGAKSVIAEALTSVGKGSPFERFFSHLGTAKDPADLLAKTFGAEDLKLVQSKISDESLSEISEDYKTLMEKAKSIKPGTSLEERQKIMGEITEKAEALRKRVSGVRSQLEDMGVAPTVEKNEDEEDGKPDEDGLAEGDGSEWDGFYDDGSRVRPPGADPSAGDTASADGRGRPGGAGGERNTPPSSGRIEIAFAELVIREDGGGDLTGGPEGSGSMS